MTTQATKHTHSCTANTIPVVDDYDSTAEEPVLSATLDSSGVEIYGRCTVCGADVTLTYELAGTEVHP